MILRHWQRYFLSVSQLAPGVYGRIAGEAPRVSEDGDRVERGRVG